MAPTPKTDRLLTAEQAAAYMGLKSQTLATWRCNRSHGLPYILVGRAVRYRLSAVEAWLAEQTVGAETE